MVIGADSRPSNLNQFWEWCERFMPRNKNVHMVGLAAICWALWRVRNVFALKRRKLDLLPRSFAQPILSKLLGRSSKV
jgi:hypothetical protein